MEVNKNILVDSALDLVSFFNIFKDDMKDEIGRLAADLERCVENNNVEIIHTGSGFEQLSLPHIENFMLWNTDADHMIIRTDVEVMEGSGQETSQSTQAETTVGTEAGTNIDVNNSVDVLDNGAANKVDVAFENNCEIADIYEKVGSDEVHVKADNNNGEVHKFIKSSNAEEKIKPSAKASERNPNHSSADINNNIQYVYDGSHAGYAFVSNKKLTCPVDTESIQKHCQVTAEFIENCRTIIPISRTTMMALNEGKITGPSYSLYTNGGSFNISRDFVYGLKCNFWPLQAQEWIHRERSFAWPSKELISASVSQGCHVVPVASHNGNLREFEWRFSFSVVELKLVQSMTDNQKLAYSILKAIIKNEMKQRKLDVFVSYHLKTTLFWFLEKSDLKMLENQSLKVNIIELLDSLIAFYNDGFLPNYFIRKNNMIAHRSSEEIFSVCAVLRDIKSDFTMSLCRYIEANQSIPVFFDVPLSQLLKDDSKKFLQVCKYNFLVMALAYILMRLRKGSAVNESAVEEVVCKLVHKASQESNLQNFTSKESSLPNEVPTTTSILGMIEKSLDRDNMKVTENSAVILAVFNLFLTFHPNSMDKIGFPANSLEFQKDLTNPAYMECLLWAGRLHEKHCDVIYDFVVKKWLMNGPNFHTEDVQAKKLMKLLMVILGKPTKQACAVTGSLLRRKIEGERFILLRVLAEYLLHIHLESSYIAFQACGYLMDRPVISEIYGFVNWGSRPTKLHAVELILSKDELKAQLSEKEFHKLVQTQHDLNQHTSQHYSLT
ncbi:uncharacterized protein LOC116292467 [Actinia tenebrosa]|uniref:Uncharacterized protein LOC116292467 n=1 Tax=Actinia tenebrosa TaxID=6105 RepID=A0A6P8HIH6_ACTTE|nr:uncharacterized protein LOC116292467 [Actinia tenebrosa]